jgi:hypothetical protein
MPTIEEIKELLERVKQKRTSSKQKDQSTRPSPLPPLSPFVAGTPIPKQKEMKDVKRLEITQEIINNIYKAGY